MRSFSSYFLQASDYFPLIAFLSWYICFKLYRLAKKRRKVREQHRALVAAFRESMVSPAALPISPVGSNVSRIWDAIRARGKCTHARAQSRKCVDTETGQPLTLFFCPDCSGPEATAAWNRGSVRSVVTVDEPARAAR